MQIVFASLCNLCIIKQILHKPSKLSEHKHVVVVVMCRMLLHLLYYRCFWFVCTLLLCWFMFAVVCCIVFCLFVVLLFQTVYNLWFRLLFCFVCFILWYFNYVAFTYLHVYLWIVICDFVLLCVVISYVLCLNVIYSLCVVDCYLSVLFAICILLCVVTYLLAYV